MFQNLGDDSVRSILLALSVTVFFLYGFRAMKKADILMAEIRKNRRHHYD